MPSEEEEISPTLENFITLHWLRLLHPDLPALVKQKYGPELRSRTLASIKPEISQALDSLMADFGATKMSKFSAPPPRISGSQDGVRLTAHPRAAIVVLRRPPPRDVASLRSRLPGGRVNARVPSVRRLVAQVVTPTT